MKAIPYGHHHITQEDIDAVIEVLQSDYLTQGPRIKEFEDEFAVIRLQVCRGSANGTAPSSISYRLKCETRR